MELPQIIKLHWNPKIESYHLSGWSVLNSSQYIKGQNQHCVQMSIRIRLFKYKFIKKTICDLSVVHGLQIEMEFRKVGFRPGGETSRKNRWNKVSNSTHIWALNPGFVHRRLAAPVLTSFPASLISPSLRAVRWETLGTRLVQFQPPLSHATPC